MSTRATASPSLALVKYWGKIPGGINIPATSSLAVTLDSLKTDTLVELNEQDVVHINGKVQERGRFVPVFDEVRSVSGSEIHFRADSSNNFPTSAGLASSSSGLAALVAACFSEARIGVSERTLSRVARIGSGSASRAVFGGFTSFPRGSQWARQVAPAEHWPTFRVVVARISAESKPVSSRDAMEHARSTSPFYEAWLHHSATLMDEAEDALLGRDLEKLGDAMRASYLSMFSTMFSSRPPIVFWLPGSLEVMHRAADLRTQGVPVWETMDAGPQVKLVTDAEHLSAVMEAVSDFEPMSSGPGDGVRIVQEDE